MGDLSGWVTAGVAIAALIVNMVGGAIRFEVRMTRLEEQLNAAKAELDAIHRRLDKRGL